MIVGFKDVIPCFLDGSSRLGPGSIPEQDATSTKQSNI